MDTICTILTALVPARSPETCQLVRVLAEHGGEFEAADMAARLSGFRTRQHMGRVLHAEGLPQLTELAGWIRVLRWVLEWEQNGRALANLSLLRGRDPAVRYRLVRKLTGRPWSEVRLLGAGWVMLKRPMCGGS